MDAEQIKEGNKIIMFFDGAENSEIDIMGTVCPAIKYKDSYYPPEGDRLPQFHKDWSLLIPIVEKIETKGAHYTIGANKFCDIAFPKEAPNDVFDVFDFYVSTEVDPIYGKYESKIEAVWLAVVDFITWYNNQKVKQ